MTKGATETYGTQSAPCPDDALSKPHAVVAAGGDTSGYDWNGNQVKRVVGTPNNLDHNADDRRTTVNGGATAAFVDGPNGDRVKRTVNGVATVYAGEHREVQGEPSSPTTPVPRG